MRNPLTARHEAIRLTLLCALVAGCQTQATRPSTPSVDADQAEHTLPRPEEYAHRLDDDSRKAWQKPDEVIDLLACPEGGTVVDLGAGTGYFVRDLSDAVGPDGRVLAIDPSQAMVEHLQDRVEEERLRNVQPHRIPTDDPNLPPRSVDRILIVNTWHHIEDRARYADKLRTALKPGGLVLIVDFTMESPIGPPEPRRLTIDTVAAELEAAGMTAEVLEESLPYQYAVAGRVP